MTVRRSRSMRDSLLSQPQRFAHAPCVRRVRPMNVRTGLSVAAHSMVGDVRLG
jgi:hypothetical protein